MRRPGDRADDEDFHQRTAELRQQTARGLHGIHGAVRMQQGACAKEEEEEGQEAAEKRAARQAGAALTHQRGRVTGDEAR
jgi:hypothetical protein